MDILSFVKKAAVHILRLTKANRILYKLSGNDIIKFDDETVKNARAALESYSPTPGTSCRCENSIIPQADVHIIIPAYNVEAFIAECMDSVVINPTKKYTCHITVINDGSSDMTGEILKKYEHFPNVEIITQANKGFSGARNTGLSCIRGKYILFVDSDDLLDWSGVEKMLDTAVQTNADIVWGAHTMIFESGIRYKTVLPPVGQVEPTKMSGHPVAKLFRSQLFRDVCFPEKYWYEDSILAQIVFPRTAVAYAIQDNAYYVRNRMSGVTNSGIKNPKAVDSFRITERLFEERREYGLEITQQYYEYMLHMVKLTFRRIRERPYEIKKMVFILFCDFIDKNFRGFSAGTKEGKEVEKIIRSRNLKKCIFYSKWM